MNWKTIHLLQQHRKKFILFYAETVAGNLHFRNTKKAVALTATQDLIQNAVYMRIFISVALCNVCLLYTSSYISINVLRRNFMDILGIYSMVAQSLNGALEEIELDGDNCHYQKIMMMESLREIEKMCIRDRADVVQASPKFHPLRSVLFS